MGIPTRVVQAKEGIDEAVTLLRAGDVVAFPTETVYGLGADARSDAAVGRIYAAKGRPSTNPLIVHVHDVNAARGVVAEWPREAERLAERFWPGPLTMVLPRGGVISAKVSAGLGTVAVRCPRHPVAEALLRAFAGPIAAPSANRSGFTSPTTAQHVYAELAGRVPLILDGGACEVGVESTVLSLVGDARILRHGGVTREMIEAVIGPVGVFAGHVAIEEAAASPGMLERHYAPRTKAYRFSRAEWEGVRRAVWERVVVITHEPGISLAAPHDVILMPPDPGAYARLLYASLREADARQASSIFVLMPDTEEGVWAAIVDRLRRATEPWPA